MLLNKKSRQESKISEYHLIDSFNSKIAATKVWFIDEFTRIEQRNKNMKKLAKKHIAWKKKTLTKYSKECEQYIHERRDWEMTVIIQTWNKSEIIWSIQISSFNHLLNLVEFEHAMQEEYITLMKNENMSRTIKNVYEDEIKKKISSDFQSEKSDNSMNESNITNDAFISLTTEEYLMSETLIEKNSQFASKHSMTSITEIIMKDFTIDSKEWVTKNEKEEITKSFEILNRTFSNHVIESSLNASHETHTISLIISDAQANKTSNQLILKEWRSTHHIRENSTQSENDYESVEEWMKFLDN